MLHSSSPVPMSKRLTATETGQGWLVEITETKIVPTADYVRDEARYLGLNENEIKIIPLPRP